MSFYVKLQDCPTLDDVTEEFYDAFCVHSDAKGWVIFMSEADYVRYKTYKLALDKV